MRLIRMMVLLALAGAGPCRSAEDIQGPVEVNESLVTPCCVKM